MRWLMLVMKESRNRGKDAPSKPAGFAKSSGRFPEGRMSTGLETPR